MNLRQLMMLPLALCVMAAPAFAGSQDAKGAAGGHMGKGHMDGKMGQMWQKMDTNGDGQVSKDEFVNARGAMFDKMDTNGDGILQDSERQAAHEKVRAEMKEKHQDRMEARKANWQEKRDEWRSNHKGRHHKADETADTPAYNE